MKDNQLKYLCIAGLFAAILTLITLVVRVPIPNTSGYVNFGDSVIYLFASLLPSPYIALAAGIGSALTDLFAGAAIYILPTFVIKALMAYTASKMIYGQEDFRRIFLALLLCEAFMVIGYFLYELLMYGVAAASVAMLYNLAQYIANVIAGMLLIQSAKKLRIHL